MTKNTIKDVALGFFSTLVTLAVYLLVPMAVKPTGLVLFLLTPLSFYLIVIVIGLIGRKKRRYGVPIGIFLFFLAWAAITLHQGQQANNFVSRVEEPSTSIEWAALPKAILTGNVSRPWKCDDDCSRALRNGLPVFTRYNKGTYRLSIDEGEKCLKPKSILASKLLTHNVPEGKCFIAEDVPKENIHAVKFIQGKNKNKDAKGIWGGDNWGKGFPNFTWTYSDWNVILYHQGSRQTIASGFTGKTQYPFWLPIPYLAFPQIPHFAFLREGSYGIFGWSRLYADSTPIGRGWTSESFIRKLAATAGLTPLKRAPIRHLKANEPRISQTIEERTAILKRLTILANSPDPADREAAAFEIEKWGEAGGDLKEIRSFIEILLHYDLSYRRYQLYAILSRSGVLIPDWLATLLITNDPDWSNRFLGIALLKASPKHTNTVERTQMKDFVKDLDLRGGDSRKMIAIALLLPRFNDESLSQIYSDCRFSKLQEIWKMSEYYERQGYEKNWKPLYSPKEKKQYARHVAHCLKDRPKKDPYRVRFEKLFGEIS